MPGASGVCLKLCSVAVPFGRWLAKSVGFCPLALDGRTAIACLEETRQAIAGCPLSRLAFRELSVVARVFFL